MSRPPRRLARFMPVLAAVTALPLLASAAGESPGIASTMDTAATVPAWNPPPGWTDTRGGDGGRVIRVTTLSARGRGSLGRALAARGRRVIEFAVGGTIDLGSRPSVIAQPHVTIAGETAPSPGITLVNGGIAIVTHDVIVRHLRIRPGAGGRGRQSGWEVDGIATSGGARDVIVDHCSVTWSTDENVSASGPRFAGATPDEWRRNTSHRITVSHCIIGEALRDSTHRKGPHSMGMLIHDNATDIAIIGNLYISNHARNPLFKGGARGAVVNNLIHNPGNRVIAYGLMPLEWLGHAWIPGVLVITGNVAQKGPSTAGRVAFADVRGPCEVYLDDNLFLDAKGRELPATADYRGAWMRMRSRRSNATAAESTGTAPPFWPPRLIARPASETAAWVLANAGARPWDRDPVDRRLVREAGSGGGRIIDFESEAEP